MTEETLTKDEEVMNDMFVAFHNICLEFDDKLSIDKISDGFLTVALDMLRHLLSHAHPGHSSKDLDDELKQYVNMMIDALSKGPWLVPEEDSDE